MGYRTEIDEDLDSPLDFVPYGEVYVPKTTAVT